MFNREYHKRAKRLAIAEELRKRGADAFYRPAKRPDPRPVIVKPSEPEQLRLDFWPLSDIFPEAYPELQRHKDEN